MDQKVKLSAFSLLELLAVMAIMLILAGLSTVAFHSVVTGSQLNRAGKMTADTILLARQEAVTRNQEVRVLFYEIGSSWKAIQVIRVEETEQGPVEKPLTSIAELPTGIVYSSSGKLSPLLTDNAAPLSGTRTIPGTPDPVTFRGFRIRPSGIPDRLTDANNYLTLVDVHQKDEEPPRNYYALQINPMTGKIATLRP